MTVSYSADVKQARILGFFRLLFRWKGSVYRLLYKQMIIFAFLYYSIAMLYRYLLNESGQRTFEDFALYCRNFTDLVPITFLLGFYVTLILGRWWQQYMAIPWPDNLALDISAYVQGDDELSRLIRRALVRYVELMYILTFQATSIVVKKRFPKLEDLVEAGVMTAEEKQLLEEQKPTHGYWWVPSVWFCNLVAQARKEGRISNDFQVLVLNEKMQAFRGKCAQIWSFDFVSVPMVYTQVAALAVYSFFIASLFGRQFLFGVEERARRLDYYVPVFTFFQFFLYMGWLKVAEEMIYPFGADDDDFELDWMMDRNLEMMYAIVDGMHGTFPELGKDKYWNTKTPQLPYPTDVERPVAFQGSTAKVNFENGGQVSSILNLFSRQSENGSLLRRWHSTSAA